MSDRPRLASVLGLLFGLLCYTPPPALSQTPAPGSAPDPWATVKAVPTGTELEVKLVDGKKLKGRLLDVSDAGLRLTRKDRLADVSRADVLKVYQVSPVPGTFGRVVAGAGAAVGAGAGIAAGLSVLHKPSFRGPSARFILLPVAGAAAGGIGGHLIARRMRSRMLIYDAGQRAPAKPQSPSPKKP